VKYVLLATLLFLAGITLAYVERQEQSFTPIVRLRSYDGLYMTLVQAQTSKRRACNRTIDEFVEALERTCPTCSVDSSECARKLDGIDGALARGDRLPIYTVAADGMRIGVVGPSQVVRAACEGMASQFVSNGSKGAACIAPVQLAN
jgi:hypothetical protein